MLNKDDKNFTKHFTLFNIKDAVNEIIETLEDKVKLKDITVETIYEGFGQEEQILIKTD